jgi:GH15 family glucan-1,4-alpha-glucosidase
MTNCRQRFPSLATDTGFSEISDYALLGDCRIAALVSRYGSIDWLCLPHFSGPSVFAKILDVKQGGSFSVTPVGAFNSRRQYIEGSAVLETTFETEGGTAVVRDAIPIVEGFKSLSPMRELLRVVEGLSGTMELDVLVDIRPDYGRSQPRVRRGLGWSFVWGNEIVHISSSDRLERADRKLRGRIRVQAGERKYVSLSYSKGDPAILPLLGPAADKRIAETVQWWRTWVARAQYDGPHRAAVERSAITLKLMHYALSGAIVAAPTMSLPEAVGFENNWDYRFCWLRDAGMTMQALLGLGYHDDAQSFLEWLLHSTRLTWPKLQIMYDVYGRTNLREQNLDHLSGYRNSRPVRLGNAAHTQLQLDVYGEVIIAADTFVSAGRSLYKAEKRMLIGLGRTLCKEWRKPDSGIWERRGEPFHYTYSKMMCWIGLDRLLSLHARGKLSLGRHERLLKAERDVIEAAIESQGFNPDLASYTDIFDGRGMDASLLRAVRAGYRPESLQRMRSTHKRIRERLGAGDGLLFRHERSNDGKRPPEGAFGICSFWSVENFIAEGNIDTADRLFGRLCSLANDVGLYGEEFELETMGALGNFPQAFTHVGLINAAKALELAHRKEQHL